MKRKSWNALRKTYCCGCFAGMTACQNQDDRRIIAGFANGIVIEFDQRFAFANRFADFGFQIEVLAVEVDGIDSDMNQVFVPIGCAKADRMSGRESHDHFCIAKSDELSITGNHGNVRFYGAGDANEMFTLALSIEADQPNRIVQQSYG